MDTATETISPRGPPPEPIYTPIDKTSKAHVGVDGQTKLVHSVATTAANVQDSQVLPKLLHGEETRVWGDAE